ncbi:DNA-binding protein [Streptomyces sp. NRRL S-481]|uniref:DNA-binding protein n=1 Tax=Streptomyces sp. NRRL S-481 TaxID=1463911 RepID=UPI0004C49C73|nr:DNA-binding protein [Streptomyces sp. NRRL S-481]
MDTQHPSAPACAQPLNPRGITHINTKHTARFTVVGNHLTQHRRLPLTAIGLACHIQSLPSGARVDIKTLAARFTEGETRIAAALRELETHGYFARTRERLPNGRIVTHTISYNHPSATQTPHRTANATPPPAPPVTPPPALSQPAEPEAGTEPQPGPAAEPKQAPEPPSAILKPPLPEPRTPDLDRHRTATTLLATLHHHDPRLLLSERDVHSLAPSVAAWLERGARPEAVRHALTSNLPSNPRRPVSLIAYRLTELLPPEAPPAPPAPSDDTHAPPPPPPFHNCEGCERAIRTPTPGSYCRDCRDAGLDTYMAA